MLTHYIHDSYILFWGFMGMLFFVEFVLSYFSQSIGSISGYLYTKIVVHTQLITRLSVLFKKAIEIFYRVYRNIFHKKWRELTPFELWFMLLFITSLYFWWLLILALKEEFLYFLLFNLAVYPLCFYCNYLLQHKLKNPRFIFFMYCVLMLSFWGALYEFLTWNYWIAIDNVLNFLSNSLIPFLLIMFFLVVDFLYWIKRFANPSRSSSYTHLFFLIIIASCLLIFWVVAIEEYPFWVALSDGGLLFIRDLLYLFLIYCVAVTWWFIYFVFGVSLLLIKLWREITLKFITNRSLESTKIFHVIELSISYCIIGILFFWLYFLELNSQLATLNSDILQNTVYFLVPFWLPFIVGVVVTIGTFESTLHASKMDTWETNDDFDISQSIERALSEFDISKIKFIRFHENNGKNFEIYLDSIKQISCFIEQKAHKTTFDAWELQAEKELLLKSYKTKLSQKDYELLIKHLSSWVEKWGSFEIVRVEE